MHSKKIKITLFIIIIAVIFSVLFMYVKKDFEVLPSEGWSKELELFDIESSSEFTDFFNKKLGYAMLNDRLNIFYVEDNLVKFKSYNEDLSFIDEGILLTLDYSIDKLFVHTKENEIKLTLENDKTFNFYSFTEELKKFDNENKYEVNNNNYDIENGYLVIRDNSNLKLVSNEGEFVLELENRPYSTESVVLDYDDKIEIYYTELRNNILEIRYAVFDENYELVTTEDIVPFMTNELRLSILEFQVVKENNTATIILNVKNEKYGNTFINYYEYDFSNNAVNSKVYEQFHDKAELISTKQMLVSFRGSVVEQFVGKKYAEFYNVMIYDINSEGIRLLTKTRLDPRNYIYIDSEPYDYLVWGELHKGKLTINISSDDPEYISSSLELTQSRFWVIFGDTIGLYLLTPTYLLVMGVSTLVMVMLVAAPGYMIFVSYFERNARMVFIGMVILHNIGKLIIHYNFISNIELPGVLIAYTVPIIIFTNLIAIYNSNFTKRKYMFDNVLLEYVPFFITDIVLHIMIFGPYVMMDL